jgi:hypothetical protein
MSSVISASLVPTYIKASSPDELRNLILKLNMITGTYRKFSIVKDGKVWYAWFEWDALEELPNLEA